MGARTRALPGAVRCVQRHSGVQSTSPARAGADVVLKRILLTTDAVGGVWRYSLELANGFAARGAHVLLGVMGPPPTAAQRSDAAAIPGLRLVSTGLPLDWLADRPAQVADAAQALAAIAARART